MPSHTVAPRPVGPASVPPPTPEALITEGGRPLARADARVVVALIYLGGAAVLALWWHDTPSVSGVAGWLINAGRITGLLAGYAVVVLLALMARIPALERGIGTDRLARWHAMGGRYTVSLTVAHATLITWGYAVLAHRNGVAETWILLRSYPDVLAATVAGGLLVGVGITSARAARARMRYETWHFLHLYTYLAVALAFSHQFSTGADFIANTRARIVWSALYVAVGGALLWYRFLAPARAFVRHQLRVTAVQREAPGIYSVLIAGRHLDELDAEPGQFFRWRFLTRDRWWAANPYSLSAPVQDGQLMRITVKDLGDHSNGVRTLRPGTRVLAEGPYGALTAARRTRAKVVLIAGGVGITPLRTLFETLPAQPGDLTLLYRASRATDVVFRAELDAIADARGATVHYLTGPQHRATFTARGLARLVPDLRHHDAYLCGPPGLTATVHAALRAAGVPARHIHHESFAI